MSDVHVNKQHLDRNRIGTIFVTPPDPLARIQPSLAWIYHYPNRSRY